jgi:hypothetical protein
MGNRWKWLLGRIFFMGGEEFIRLLGLWASKRWWAYNYFFLFSFYSERILFIEM